MPEYDFPPPTTASSGGGSPAQGGSGTGYPSLTVALATETATELTGLVPQGGTGMSSLVGPSTLSAIDDFYKDWYVVNTDTTPTNGLVAQYCRVSSYVGATRTLILDKPLDFSAESDFALIDPARIALVGDGAEDLVINKSCILSLGGHRLKGKVDITNAKLVIIVGGDGKITNGVQKTDFGALKIQGTRVSRRDATIYAVLLTNGSDLGRCELTNCEFFGRVAGRRGYSGWSIQNCKNHGVNDTVYNVPYALVESIAGVSITLSALDIALDSQFSGATVYSENSIAGATGYYSVLGSLRGANDHINTNDSSRRVSFFTAVGGATLSVTLTSGRVLLSPGDVNASADSVATGIIEQMCFLDCVNFTGTCSVTMSTGGNVRCIVPNVSNGAAVEISGSTTMSGSVTLAGTDSLNFHCGLGGGVIMLRIDDAVSGSITISGGAVTMLGGSTALVVFAGNINSGSPSINISKGFTAQYGSTAFRYFIYGAILITTGTFTFSGGIFQPGCVFTANTITLSAVVSGGTWTVSGTIGISSLINGGVAQIFCEHQGTGGTITISNTISFVGFNCGWATIAQATGAGSTVSVTSATVDLRGLTVSSTSMVRAVTATSSASVTGVVTFMYCTFLSGYTLLLSTTAGSVAAGPSTLLFDKCSFASTLVSESGTGTFTWTGAAMRYRDCHFEGLVTIVGTRFATIEFFHSRFSASSSNNSVNFSGTRPTTYRYWKCSSLALLHAAGTPDVLDEYQVLPAAGSQTAANLVTSNASGQTTNAVAGTNVILGVLVNSPGGAGQAAIVLTKGKIMVAVSAGVAAGDHLVADTAGTPTNGVTNTASVSGKNVGFALEARGNTVANQSYSAVEVS